MRGRNGPRGATPAETIGQVISRVDAVLGDIRPDAVLILGDTNSCLAAIAAERRRIPVFHMEAGVFGCVPGSAAPSRVR